MHFSETQGVGGGWVAGGGGWRGKVGGGDILRGELKMTAYYDKYRRHGVMDTRKALKVREAKDNMDIRTVKNEKGRA